MLEFHHIGLLTKVPDLARRNLELFGYQASDSVFDPEQNVTLCMCHSVSGAPRIEIVTPSEENKSLLRLLHRKDDYIYHVCFSVPEILLGLNELSKSSTSRITEVMPPKPAILFNGARVAFYSIPGLGLVELLEKKP